MPAVHTVNRAIFNRLGGQTELQGEPEYRRGCQNLLHVPPSPGNLQGNSWATPPVAGTTGLRVASSSAWWFWLDRERGSHSQLPASILHSLARKMLEALLPLLEHPWQQHFQRARATRPHPHTISGCCGPPTQHRPLPPQRRFLLPPRRCASLERSWPRSSRITATDAPPTTTWPHSSFCQPGRPQGRCQGSAESRRCGSLCHQWARSSRCCAGSSAQAWAESRGERTIPTADYDWACAEQQQQ